MYRTEPRDIFQFGEPCCVVMEFYGNLVKTKIIALFIINIYCLYDRKRIVIIYEKKQLIQIISQIIRCIANSIVSVI